jgi:hypothetical protein
MYLNNLYYPKKKIKDKIKKLLIKYLINFLNKKFKFKN